MKPYNRKIVLPLSLLLLLSGNLFAQTGGDPLSGQDEHEVVKDFDASLEETPKPTIEAPSPQLSDAPEELDYDENEYQVETEYTPAEAKIPSPSPPTWPALQNSFLKLGFGRFATPLAKLHLHNGRNTQADIGLDFSHISASNTSAYADYAEFREDSGTVNFAYLTDRHQLGVKVHAFNTGYFYYADTLVEMRPELKDSIRAGFTRIQATTWLAKNFSTQEPYYNVALQFRGFFNTKQDKDLHFSALPTLSWPINDFLDASVSGQLTFTNSEFLDTAQTRLFIGFSPKINIHWNRLQAMAGLNVNSFTDSNGVFGAYPFLEAGYQLIDQKLRLRVGITGSMQYKPYYDLITENRYLSRNIAILPEQEKFRFYTALEATFAKHFNLSVEVYSRKVENKLIYFSPESGAYFQAVYDSNFTESGAKLDLTYNYNDKVRAGVKGVFRNFNTADIPYYFNEPANKATLWGSYTFNKKIWLSTEVYFYGDRVMSVSTGGSPIRQNLQADVNFSADYRFSKWISVFLELNNILGNKYYRWHNYLERPFDMKAGITLSF